jgi:hypothetical protein
VAETPVVAEPSSSDLTFLGFGDWGRGGDFHQRDVAEQMGWWGEAPDGPLVFAGEISGHQLI